MKWILLFLLCSAHAAGQDTIFWDDKGDITATGGAGSMWEIDAGVLLRWPDCEEVVSFSDWSPQASSECNHHWVYAEWRDVNTISMQMTLEYCPCGCGGTENEARICSVCLFEQARQKTTTYKEVERQSEYMRLQNQKSRQ